MQLGFGSSSKRNKTQEHCPFGWSCRKKKKLGRIHSHSLACHIRTLFKPVTHIEDSKACLRDGRGFLPLWRLHLRPWPTPAQGRCIITRWKTIASVVQVSIHHVAALLMLRPFIRLFWWLYGCLVLDGRGYDCVLSFSLWLLCFVLLALMAKDTTAPYGFDFDYFVLLSCLSVCIDVFDLLAPGSQMLCLQTSTRCRALFVECRCVCVLQTWKLLNKLFSFIQALGPLMYTWIAVLTVLFSLGRNTVLFSVI